MSQIDTFDVLAHRMGNACGCTPKRIGEHMERQAPFCLPVLIFLVRKDRHGNKHTVSEMPYWSEQACDRTHVPNIIGVKIGATVKDSGTEIPPRKLMFPFSSEELNTAIVTAEQAATTRWYHENSRWFCLRSPHKKDYAFRHAPYSTEATWGGRKPRGTKIRKLADEFCREDYPGIFRECIENRGGRERRVDKGVFVPFMGTKWLVKEQKSGACNDR